MATRIEAKKEMAKVPFYRNPQIISRVIDIITPDRTLAVMESFFRYEEEPDFARQVKHYLEKDYWPVGVFSHFVLSDAFALAIAARKITSISHSLRDPEKHLAGFYVQHQGTMETGNQGANVQVFTLRLEPAMARHDMHYLATISKKHEKAYHLNPEEVAKTNAESIRKLKSAAKDKMGLLRFPAGNMEAARKGTGMEQSNLHWVTQMSLEMVDRSTKILFIPGVIFDTPRISGPNRRDLTAEAYRTFVRNFITELVPFGIGRPLQAKLATLKMLRPYPCDKLALDLTKLTGKKVEQGNWVELGLVMNSNKIVADQLIMGIISDKMPNSLRGNYYSGYSNFGLGDYATTLY